MRFRLRKHIGTLLTCATMAVTPMAVGCAGQFTSKTIRPRLETQVETYEINFDIVPIQTAIRLYMEDNHGRDPKTREDLFKYIRVDADANNNGVRDYQQIIMVYKKAGQVFQIYTKLTKRAEATESSKPEVREYWYRLNKDGSVTIRSSSKFEVRDAVKKFNNILKNYKKHQKYCEKATSVYEKVGREAVKPRKVNKKKLPKKFKKKPFF